MSERPCPVCGGVRRTAFLERKDVPVFQNAPAASEAEAIATPRGELQLVLCRDCGFVANDAFRPVAYGGHYENEQSHSGVFEAHLRSLVDELVRSGVAGRRVLEVGCGAGAFLRRLCAAGGNQGVGYDPAYRGPAADGALRFVAATYEGQREDPDVVVSRHVIEHVPDPIAFLAGLRAACGDRADARLFVETPAVEWILERRVLEDFFYEHCSYFSEGALRYAAERTGFQVKGVTALFGGQYQWLEGTPAVATSPKLPDPARVARLEGDARGYGEALARRLAALRDRLGALGAAGPVAVWGAGAKGVTLVNLADPARRLVACLVDINPNKQDRFVPGTGHPIVAPARLREQGVRDVVVTNPNYLAEVRVQARQVDPAIRVHACEAP
jgi:hypothetical protein